MSSHPHVFVNRTLNLRKIKCIGFDMDHTLVRYNSREFEALTYGALLEKLIQNKNYPESIRSLKFDYERAIRGLIIDRKLGNLHKISRHCAIRTSYHGTQQLDYKTQSQLFKSFYIDLGESRYVAIDTSFSIAVAALFSQLVDLKDGAESARLPAYSVIADDLLTCLDQAHKDGSLKGEVAKDLQRFLIKDPSVVADLEKFVRHGKRLFVLTNSEWEYAKLLLDYTITPFLKDHKSWLDLFEFVIVQSAKPRFFYDNLQFLKINPDDGTMRLHTGPLTRGAYHGGSAKIFTDSLQIQADDILYVGDHIYGDILRLKKDCGWRTALVIEELGAEIEALKKLGTVQKEINDLMDSKEPLEDEIVGILSAKIEKGAPVDEQRLQDLQTQTAEIDKQISARIVQHQKHFNPYWGEIMRAGNEESYFAHQVDRFACIYMEKLGDLMALSPRTYFRAARRPLAHELDSLPWWE